MFAEVIINSNAKALNKIFDYIVPISMENNIKIGSRIFVPFGRGKKLEDGFVINLKENSEFANKEIEKIEEENSLSEEQIILAKLMSRKYFCNICYHQEQEEKNYQIEQKKRQVILCS